MQLLYTAYKRLHWPLAIGLFSGEFKRLNSNNYCNIKFTFILQFYIIFPIWFQFAWNHSYRLTPIIVRMHSNITSRRTPALCFKIRRTISWSTWTVPSNGNLEIVDLGNIFDQWRVFTVSYNNYPVSTNARFQDGKLSLILGLTTNLFKWLSTSWIMFERFYSFLIL